MVDYIIPPSRISGIVWTRKMNTTIHPKHLPLLVVANSNNLFIMSAGMPSPFYFNQETTNATSNPCLPAYSDNSSDCSG